MIFADRLKLLRKKNGYTQVTLAETLGLSKGTVAMWESGKRTPDYEVINTLSEMFDRRIDYLLGYSDDPTSPKLIPQDGEPFGEWETQSELIDVFRQYLALDEYGKMNVKSLITRETIRCQDQGTAHCVKNVRIKVSSVDNK